MSADVLVAVISACAAVISACAMYAKRHPNGGNGAVVVSAVASLVVLIAVSVALLDWVTGACGRGQP